MKRFVKPLPMKTRLLREKVTDRNLERSIAAFEAARKISVALKPLSPQKRARVLRAAAALHGFEL